MSADALRDALLARPIMADTMEDGLDVLIKRLGGEMSRATVVAAVQEVRRVGTGVRTGTAAAGRAAMPLASGTQPAQPGSRAAGVAVTSETD
jgi:hypothetical protein